MCSSHPRKGEHMTEQRVDPKSVGCKIFKPCESRCTRCKACREFQKVLSQIDLTAQSKWSKMPQKEWIERR